MGYISDGSVGHGSIPMTHCLLWIVSNDLSEFSLKLFDHSQPKPGTSGTLISEDLFT